MDRSLISWNIPNLITIPLMAVLGWFLIVIVWQLAMKAWPSNGGPQGSSTGGGY